MPLFKISSGQAILLKTSGFKREQDLQSFVEKNLETVFGLRFVDTEFGLHGYRVDTVAFDEENSSLVVIEYKKGEDYSVIDQGFTYLNLLLTYKAAFQMLLLDKLGKKMRVDWSQSKILFVANSFSEYQLGAIAIKDLPVELWRYSLFEDGLIEFEQVEPPMSEVSIKSLKPSRAFERVSREIKVYTLESHLKKGSEPVQESYFKLRDEILSLDSQIKENMKKQYIAFRMVHNFVELIFQRTALRVHLDISIKELNDPRRIAEDCSKVGHWATGDTRFKVRRADEVPYAMSLIRQSYEKTK